MDGCILHSALIKGMSFASELTQKNLRQCWRHQRSHPAEPSWKGGPMLMPERDASDGGPISCLLTGRSHGIWAWHLALSIKQPDTNPSLSDSTDILINVMGIHLVTWSWLPLLNTIQQLALCCDWRAFLKACEEPLWRKKQHRYGGSHRIWVVSLVSLHFCAVPHAVDKVKGKNANTSADK